MLGYKEGSISVLSFEATTAFWFLFPHLWRLALAYTFFLFGLNKRERYQLLSGTPNTSTFRVSS